MQKQKLFYMWFPDIDTMLNLMCGRARRGPEQPTIGFDFGASFGFFEGPLKGWSLENFRIKTSDVNDLGIVAMELEAVAEYRVAQPKLLEFPRR
jgi:hypothetical protein